MASSKLQFQLLRYFSFVSAIITVVVTLAVVLVYQSHQTATLLRTAEDQNVTLTRAFANALWSRHGQYLNSAGNVQGDELRARPETVEIDRVLRLITKYLPVLKVKIFNLDGLTIYSSDFSQIGESRSDNPGFLKAVRQATPASKTSYRGTFSAFSGVRANVHLAESYVPIVDESGKVTSIFELYTDVTPQIAGMQDDIWAAAILAVIASCTFYLLLLLVVRRADVILKRQHNELSSFNAQLEIASAKLDVALKYMSNGLAMFDAERRLVVVNEQYAKVYGLPQQLIKPGMTQKEVLEHRVALGCMPVADTHKYIQGRTETASASQVSDAVVELSNDRYVAVAHRPLPGGGWVSTHEDITHRKRAEAQIAYMALHDAMTGLPNRIMLQEELARAAARWLRHSEKSALLFLDLDGFKAVNDTHGHMAGDELLKQVAKRLRSCVRETEFVARLGGDEFAILQSKVEQPSFASGLAARVIEALAHPFMLGDVQVSVGASVGIAVAPQDGPDADLLLRNADLALYRAKADGKGRFRFFEATMDLAVHARRALEVELRDAYRNGEFELFYQPIVRFDTGEASGFEALIRWNHPQRGMVAPAEFISVAEETGLISLIGEWVIRQACREAAGWPPELRVTVNVSSRQFGKDTNLLQTVLSALASSGLAPHRLELEITESVLIAENEEGLHTLRQLQDLGVSIALDDFGTGYSSLGYLRRFPFNKIKIDRSFVREMATSAECMAIVRAVSDLAKSLGSTTVGEGVETSEQLEQLRAMGCAEVQGYFLSPPTPCREVGRLIQECGSRIAKAA